MDWFVKNGDEIVAMFRYLDDALKAFYTFPVYSGKDVYRRPYTLSWRSFFALSLGEIEKETLTREQARQLVLRRTGQSSDRSVEELRQIASEA